MKEKYHFSASQRLAETGIMISVALVASLIPLLELPYGGSITACSGLPIFIIAYRFGTPWGMFAGFVYGLLQLLLGMRNVMFFTSPLSIAAVILLDYLLAYSALALGGIWRKWVGNQTTVFCLGIFTGCLLRYLCHVISGCTVWAGLSIPSKDALLYSLAYNATYMIPETIVMMTGGFFLAGSLDFSGNRLRNFSAEGPKKGKIFSFLGWGAILAALVCDVIFVFGHLQNAETGTFDIQGLARVNWPAVGGCSAIGLLLGGLFLWLNKKRNLPKEEQSAGK